MKQFYRIFFIFAMLSAPVVGIQFVCAQDTTFLKIDTCASSYLWHDTTYNESGTYYFTDSILTDTLDLTLNQPDSVVDEQVHCETYTWIDNVTYTESTNTPTVILTNTVGCDSVVTLHLTINHSTKSDTTATACDSLKWHGHVYKQIGHYKDTLENAAGCDSIVTLNLTIYPSIDTVKNIVCKRKSDKDKTPYMLVYPDPGKKYQWYKNGVPIDGATKQYYAPDGGLPLDTTYKYTVRVATMDINYCYEFTEEWHYYPVPSPKMRILPNPNDGQFRLQLPDDAVSVQILNANGQVVMTRKAEGDELLEMNTGLVNGLYFVKTFLKDGSCNTEKLIINR